VSKRHSHNKKLFGVFSEYVQSWTCRVKEGLLRFCGDIKCGEKCLLEGRQLFGTVISKSCKSWRLKQLAHDCLQ
jgi:hypothetical protein